MRRVKSTSKGSPKRRDVLRGFKANTRCPQKSSVWSLSLFSAPPSFACSYRGVEVTAVYFYTVPSPLKRRRLNWLEQCLNNQGAVSLWTNFTRREIQMWRPLLWLSFWFRMQRECERPLPHLVAPFGWSLILSTLEQEWWSQNKHCKSGKDKSASHSVSCQMHVTFAKKKKFKATIRRNLSYLAYLQV